MGGGRGRQTYKVLFLPCLISYWGPASLLPAPGPALHCIRLPKPAFSLFPEPLLRSRGWWKTESRAFKKSPALAESGSGASVFNLEQTLGCRDQQVTDGETEAQRGSGTCSTSMPGGGHRSGLELFSCMLATFYKNLKEIVVTQSGILHSEIVTK